MKKYFWLCLILFSSFSILISQTIVGTFPCPPNGRGWGLEYIDGYLYMGDDGDGFIYKIDPATGNTVSTISSPYDNNHIAYGCNHGLAWDGTGLWVAGDYGKDYLYKIGLDGSVHDSIDIQNITSAVGGLAWDGTYLLMSSYYPNTMGPIYKIDVNSGTVAGQIPSPGNQPYGVAWDGSNIWNGMDDNDGDPENIYELDPADGGILSQFASPATAPKGIAFGGGYMWLIAGGTGNNQIYQIDPGGSGTPEINLPIDSHNFGITTVQDSSFWNVIVQNTGDADLIINSLSSDAPQFGFSAVDLPLTISSAGYAELETFFTPDNPGYFTANLSIESNDPLSPTVQIQVEGNGVVSGPSFYTDSYYHYFGSCWLSGISYWEIAISNLGSTDLTISSMSTSTENFFVNPDQDFPIQLQPLETEFITILFQPHTEGSFEDTLNIITNDPLQPSVSVYLEGNGYPISNVFGELLWMAQGVENVEAVTAINDINGDDIPDVCFESYDAGVPQDKDHLFGILGNSSGEGIAFWSNRPQGGESNSGGWGNQCLSATGDLNSDGYDDILLGTAWGGRTVFAIDGHTGESIWTYDTYNEDGEGGWVYSVNPMPDISGDGIPEALAGVGSSNSGYAGPRSIYCFNGANGNIIWRYQGNDACISVHALNDVNGDGVADAVAGFGGNDLDTRLVVISGATGDLLWQYTTGGSVWMVNRINDLNNDDINDVIAGSWDGKVYAFSGIDGSVIWDFNVGTYIMMVVPLRDVNMDDKDEVIVASWANSVLVISGNSGSLLWSYDCGNSVWAVDASPDLDADGFADVLAGDFDGDVMAIRGNDGTLIWSQNVGSKVFDINWSEDVTGDGGTEVIAGTQMLGGMGGQTFLFSGGFSCWDYPGDVNDDGEINIIDITKIVCMILHTCEVEPCAWMNSDFNLDGDVNVMDIVGIVQYILNNPRNIVAGSIGISNTLKLLPLNDNQYKLTLSNNEPVYGLQIRLNGDKDISLPYLSQFQGFELIRSKRKSNITLLGFSPYGATIPPGEHEIGILESTQKPVILSSTFAVEGKSSEIYRKHPIHRTHLIPETPKISSIQKQAQPILISSQKPDGYIISWNYPDLEIAQITIYKKPGLTSFFSHPEILSSRIVSLYGNHRFAAVQAMKTPDGFLKIEGYQKAAVLPPDSRSFSIDHLTEESTFIAGFHTLDNGIVLSRPLPLPAKSQIPDRYILYGNYPNPFNPSTTIRFGIPKKTHVNLAIYDIKGKTVKNLINADYAAGNHKIVWDGKDEEGCPVSTGIYISVLKYEGKAKSIKMALMK